MTLAHADSLDSPATSMLARRSLLDQAITADDWLLAQYELGRPILSSVGHIRPLLDLLDDHDEDECAPDKVTGRCMRWSTPATWHAALTWATRR